MTEVRQPGLADERPTLVHLLRRGARRSLPLGLAVGLGVAGSILLGWSAWPLALLCVLLAPAGLPLVLLPEEVARSGRRTPGRDLLASLAVACTAAGLTGAVFLNLGFLAAGGATGLGYGWLDRVLRDPEPDFVALLFSVGVGLGGLVDMRLRAIPAAWQTTVLPVACLVFDGVLFAGAGQHVAPGRFGSPVFVDLAYYLPLKTLVLLAAPLLLAWGDRRVERSTPAA